MMTTTTTMMATTTTTATTTPAMAALDKPGWPDSVLPTNNIYLLSQTNRLERLTGHWIHGRRGISYQGLYVRRV